MPGIREQPGSKCEELALSTTGPLYPDQQRQWFTDVSTKFQAQTGATVKFETFASGNDELTKIQTSVLSGQGLIAATDVTAFDIE